MSGLPTRSRRLEGIEGIGVVRFSTARRRPPPDRRADRRGLRGLQRPGMIELEVDIEEPWPPAPTGRRWPTRAARRRGRSRARARQSAPVGQPAVHVATTRSTRSTASGASRTSRPTCCRSRCSSREELLALAADGPPELLGDIALAYETCAREAAEKGVPLADHAAHLIVHGLLHLAGLRPRDLAPPTPRRWRRSKQRRLRCWASLTHMATRIDAIGDETQGDGRQWPQRRLRQRRRGQ